MVVVRNRGGGRRCGMLLVSVVVVVLRHGWCGCCALGSSQGRERKLQVGQFVCCGMTVLDASVVLFCCAVLETIG